MGEDKRFERYILAEQVTSGIVESYKTASDEEKKEIEASYLLKVREAVKEDDKIHIYFLLRAFGLGTETVIEAQRIVAEKHIEEMDSLAISWSIPPELRREAIRLLGQQGKVGPLIWLAKSKGLLDDETKAETERAITEALHFLVNCEDRKELLGREGDIKKILYDEEIGKGVKDSARAALHAITNPLIGNGVLSDAPKKPEKTSPGKKKKITK